MAQQPGGVVSDTAVGAAAALGWQMAQLFHEPVHKGPVGIPTRSDRLPGRSHFTAATLSKWLGEQIQHGITSVFSGGTPPNVTALVSQVLDVLSSPDRSRAAALDAVHELHCALLEQLNVTDFRLGKAYGLGRALAETALMPAQVTAGKRTTTLEELFEPGRLGTIEDWLFDLKTLLPPHTAYAMRQNLHDWRAYLDGVQSEEQIAAVCSGLKRQGRIWRTLLTGEKSATDMLKLGDYLQASQAVAFNAIGALRPYAAFLAVAGIVALAVIAIVIFIHVSTSAKLFAGLIWLAGILGISLKAVGGLLGGAIKDGSGWFWQSELDEAVAGATIVSPAVHARPLAKTVGELPPSQDAS